MHTKNISWVTATILWLVNPVFSGCESGTEKEFQFGEAELLDILDEVNEQSWEVTFDGERSTITVDLAQIVDSSDTEGDQASLWSAIGFGSAHACDSRNFLAEAEACIDTSSLPIEGTLTVSSNLDIESEPQVFEVSGSLDVFGTILNNAEIWVNSDDIQVNWRVDFDEEGQTNGVELEYVE